MDADPCANVANALEELEIGTEEAMKHQARTSLGKKRMKIKKMAIYCPQGSGTLRQQLLIIQGIAWYCMLLHGIAW